MWGIGRGRVIIIHCHGRVNQSPGCCGVFGAMWVTYCGSGVLVEFEEVTDAEFVEMLDRVSLGCGGEEEEEEEEDDPQV